MSWPWRSPRATRQALSDRVKARYAHEQRPQRLREVAYRRLLARLFSAQPERWVVKGGAALLLRLDPNRTSNDIDLAYVAEAGEYAVALRALDQALAYDADDFFAFELDYDGMTEVDPDHPLERSLGVPVVARLGGTVIAEFSIDLVLPRDDVIDVEWIKPGANLTGEPAVDTIPAVALLTLAAQVADKVCALFERHGADGRRSSRAEPRERWSSRCRHGFASPTSRSPTGAGAGPRRRAALRSASPTHNESRQRSSNPC